MQIKNTIDKEGIYEYKGMYFIVRKIKPHLGYAKNYIYTEFFK